MNGLKALNETHGHAAGDKAIERMAKTLVLASRQSDLVGRLGGDEFAVLLPHTTVEGALAQAARVQHLLQTLPLWLEEGKVSLTLSTAFGAAAFDGNSTATDVMQLADTHMYHHKKRTKAQ